MVFLVRPILFLSLATSIAVFPGNAHALVVSAPGVGNFDQQSTFSRESNIAKSMKLRIRSTEESDIQEISDILASALVGSSDDTTDRFNWKAHIELLRTKSGVDALLRSRVQAIHAAKHVECSVDLDEADKLHVLWSNDKFRQRTEKAALLSSEPHVWRVMGHNFNCAPQDSCWLQHKMITATDASTGEIVGFCEVAMLSRPSPESGVDKVLFAPTIMNLATSPKYRRQGIATRLLESTSRFVRQEWKCQELSLYVDGKNEAAISLYNSMGFGRKTDLQSNNDFSAQLYMAKQFIPSFG